MPLPSSVYSKPQRGLDSTRIGSTGTRKMGHDRCSRSAVVVVRFVKMNLRLVPWPLARRTDQKHNLGLNRFDVQAGVGRWGVVMAPDVEADFGVMMPPSVPVIAGLTRRIPAEPKSIAKWLFRDPDVDRFLIHTHDI